MFSTAKLERHQRLSTDMAEKLGIDLEEVAMRGEVPPEELQNVVLRCTACSEAQACRDWLGDHPNGGALPPAYCRNKDLFKALMPED